jgi:hypothetical protein
MNSWIVQANRTQWLVDWYLYEYTLQHLNEPEWWVVHKYQRKEIFPNDEVFIWRAATEPSRDKAHEYYDWRKSQGIKSKISGICARGIVEDSPKKFNAPPEELIKFTKYRLVDSWKFDDNDWKIECSYKNPTNIRATSPLLKEVILKELNSYHNSHITSFSNFLKVPRGKRCVKLDLHEAAVIRMLFNTA